MASLQRSRLTQYGIARKQAGGKMIFTTVGLGDGIITDSWENLGNEKQRFAIADHGISGGNFWASCAPKGIEDPNGIYLREIALYIADENYSYDRDYDHVYCTAWVNTDGSANEYALYIPSDPKNWMCNYEFAIHTIIPESAQVEIAEEIIYDGSIASEALPGAVRSNNAYGNVSVDPVTGVMQTNGLVEKLAAIETAINGLGG